MSERVIAIEGGYKLNGTVRISGAKNASFNSSSCFIR